MNRAEHDRMANAIRALAMDAVEQAKSGHPGLPMGAADIATVLFTQFLKFDPADPTWPDRDRFVLSAGHGSMLIYALLHLLGYEAVTLDEIKRFRQIGSLTPGHPENFITPGVETTTGPLGQGLANAVGMAIAERHLAAEFGNDIVDHSTYVLASDGDLMEGISQEAIALAGHLKLAKLIVLFDDNGISIDGPLSLADSVDQVKRFEAAGWAAIARSTATIRTRSPPRSRRPRRPTSPTLIACKTTIGYGAPTKAGKSSSHGSPLGADEIKGAREKLGWSDAPFQIPTDVLTQWRAAGQRSKTARKEWDKRLAALPADKRAEFERRMRGDLPGALADAVRAVKESLAKEPKDIATRTASEFALESLVPAVPEMVGGSADLTGSNNTRTKSMKAMTAADYLRPLHPLRRARARHGRRHERHGAASRHHPLLRHVPGVRRLLPPGDPARRADGRARHPRDDPRLHRPRRGRADPPAGRASGRAARDPEPQRVPALRRGRDAGVLAARAGSARDAERAGADAAEPAAASPDARRAQQRCAAGAYEISPAQGKAQVSIFATGSEVSIAVEAQKLLAAKGVPARVVSVPCFELFLAAPDAARRAVIGDAPVKIGVEAAVRQGWDAIIGTDGVFVGMSGFGASAPYKDLYKHFGITAEKVAEAALNKLGKVITTRQPRISRHGRA